MQDKEQSSLLQETAYHILEHIRAEFPEATRITAAEFWAHLRKTDGAHQLHVDTDEALLQDGKPQQTLPHPVPPLEPTVASHA